MAQEDLSQIAQAKLRSEETCVARILAQPPYDAATTLAIKRQAWRWVSRIRREPDRHTLLDRFLAEYGLSNAEGVALMCLAEAFLRIPDSLTAELLLRDKLALQDWEAHLGQADSWLVNSSTWALMLTGKTLNLGRSRTADDWFNGLVAKLGQPLMQTAVRAAMQILGREFVLGESITDALDGRERAPTLTYSFDMLGEGARDAASAERYFRAYERAISAVGRCNAAERRSSQAANSVSIKISALHPRYTPLQQARSERELLERLGELCEQARRAGVPVSFDAEESWRLQFSLSLYAALADRLPRWDGLGFVVQAYGKRAPLIIDWLARLARQTRHVLPVRLVKGAYWDTEIKLAQQQGLRGFPVYTRKVTTDGAYLHCAARLLAAGDALSPQFATHNAHTISAVLAMAAAQQETANIEFQRLHGMGEHLYQVVADEYPDTRVRVYAPVGKHTDLLAYLVRRLLENGANSSFVNRLADADVPVETLLRDPFDQMRTFVHAENPRIRAPSNLYGRRRVNSTGIDLSDLDEVARYWPPQRLAAMTLHSLCARDGLDLSSPVKLTSPVDGQTTGATVFEFDCAGVDSIYADASAAQPTWDALGGVARAEIFERIASSLETHRAEMCSLLCYEAGKTLDDAINEIREAVDFCRYYADCARTLFARPAELVGATGESNELSLHGRGVFVCISPWNFPLAIFVGQVSAALLAGNSVLAKPAEQTPRIAHRLVRLMFDAGVPREVLQLVLGGADVGQAVVSHPRCAGVAFTGSIAVAQVVNRTLAARDAPLAAVIAETGGQNVMLVDSTALPEQVVDDVVRSAFLSAGQRCSAVRVLALQEDIATPVIELLKGAMDALVVGQPQQITTDLGPIITEQACEQLLEYVRSCIARGFEVYTPGLDQPDSGWYCLPTLVELPDINALGAEQFGPILHIVRFGATGVDALVEQINALGYGLTFGVHTRLDGRATQLAQRISAGNIYVNRNTTGAVVGTQPFGGHGLSGTGPKAGGPNYMQRFAIEKTVTINTSASGGNIELLGR